MPLFRVTASARTAHMYVIGMSGKGESKLLEYCLYQDIAASRGCGLIDPHSLLADDLLRLLVTRNVLADPDIRHRLIYVDPARTDYVVPFNVLATQAEHTYDVAASVLEAFRRTWPECLSEAPHFSNVVTAALIVLIENGLTLMHMPRLLTNSEFREQCLERVTDSSIVEFFHGRYDQWGREAPLLRESTLNKIGAFSLNPRLKLMLGQEANHLDLRAIMDEDKILLLDLGHSDGETTTLSGRPPPPDSRAPDGARSSWTPRWNRSPARATPSEPAAKPKLRPPDVETLMEWEVEGGCEAACPHHCWVEPGGTCPHGHPSWLLKGGGRGHLRRMPPGGDDASRRAGHRLPDADRPGQIREVFERTGYGCLAAEANVGVVHVCHAADQDIEGFAGKPVL